MSDPRSRHQRAREEYERRAAMHETRALRLSFVQLALFFLSVVLAGSGLYRGSFALFGGGLGAFVLFLVVYIVQGRVVAKRDAARTRRDIHDRHLRRIDGAWRDLPTLDGLLPPDHPYASDLDLVGKGSLVQRIDTTHTIHGARALGGWLATPASPEIIRARQAAVAELAPQFELREELEAAVLETGRDRLDADPFLVLMGERGLLEEKLYLAWVARILPALTVTLGALGYYEVIPRWIWLLPFLAQLAVLRTTEPRSRRIYEAMGAKRGFVDAFVRLFVVVEGMAPRAPHLGALLDRLKIEGAPPSTQMRRLERWVGFFELRETGIVHVAINPLLLWDLNCQIGIEKWIRTVGRRCSAWFDVLGELEALAALSVLLDQDPSARLPEIAEVDEPLEATALAHPLLQPNARVANDLALAGPGSCAIVTGSNMAGKSTLLRAVGVNIALALAGGPVIAAAMRVPPVRLRASMRVADSLQEGASYFQAELARLRSVVEDAGASPPIFFLLDELLRGTNAKARHIGARAVVKHLLDRRATGLVATHDVALSELEAERPGRVQNLHFTDVIENGEMIFDYRLRHGVVKTSNALRLLAKVGIEVEDDPILAPRPGVDSIP